MNRFVTGVMTWATLLCSCTALTQPDSSSSSGGSGKGDTSGSVSSPPLEILARGEAASAAVLAGTAPDKTFSIVMFEEGAVPAFTPATTLADLDSTAFQPHVGESGATALASASPAFLGLARAFTTRAGTSILGLGAATYLAQRPPEMVVRDPTTGEILAFQVPETYGEEANLLGSSAAPTWGLVLLYSLPVLGRALETQERLRAQQARARILHAVAQGYPDVIQGDTVPEEHRPSLDEAIQALGAVVESDAFKSGLFCLDRIALLNRSQALNSLPVAVLIGCQAEPGSLVYSFPEIGTYVKRVPLIIFGNVGRLPLRFETDSGSLTLENGANEEIPMASFYVQTRTGSERYGISADNPLTDANRERTHDEYRGPFLFPLW